MWCLTYLSELNNDGSSRFDATDKDKVHIYCSILYFLFDLTENYWNDFIRNLKHLKQIKLLTEQFLKNEAPDICWFIDLEDSGRRIQQ